MADSSKMQVANEAVEFLADPLEIEHSRLPWFSRIGIFWIAVIVIAVLLWACLSEVDVIVRAQGRIVSDRGDIVMKPREAAVIEKIAVHKGDIVEKGQPLLVFDQTPTKAELARLEREVAVLQAEAERWQAEFYGREFVPAAENEYTRMQKAIWKQRQGYYTERINSFDSNQKRILIAEKSTQESYAKYQEILDSMKKIEEMYEKLYAKNITSYKERLEVAINRMQNEAEVDRLRNQLVEYRQQQINLESERRSFIEEWKNGIAEKMVALNRELDGTQKSLDKVRSLASYVVLSAPCRAVVHDMASFPVGSAVGEAEALITLVPLDGKLEIEAEVRAADISKVHVGSHTRIKLHPFPFQRYGTLDGVIRLLSENTFQRQGGGASGNEHGGAFYRANVLYSGNLRTSDNKECTLLPGMEAEVEIKTGKRRIIEYLIYPLIKGLDESFREP